MTRAVSARGRATDALALAVLAGGSAVYLWAFAGMRALQERRITAAPGELLVTRWDLYSRASRWGIALAAGGIAIGVVAHLWHRFRRQVPPEA
ncbi:MAG TPA: hypothetical protein VNA89_09600 [Gemmatimonadaceae bacterium]|nr:hypothetical protein [Gemmatimonadaceae bacterium]